MSSTSVPLSYDSKKIVQVINDDISNSALKRLLREPLVAWDIETSGLDWTSDCIATCQVYAPSVGAIIVRVRDNVPGNLITLLGDESVIKIFHHAMFDLRFMQCQWNAQAATVYCTKIASKLFMPGAEDTSLQTLLSLFLGVKIDKAERLSNWFSKHLTATQLSYAASDVKYLPDLMLTLRGKLVTSGRWDLAVSCFEFLPNRVLLDILGAGDVFAYRTTAEKPNFSPSLATAQLPGKNRGKAADRRARG